LSGAVTFPEKSAPPGQTVRRFHFIDSTKIWGGEERFVLDLACGLSALNFEVAVHGRPGGEFLRRLEAAGLDRYPLYVNFDYDPRPLWKLPKFSEEEIFVAVTPRDFKLLRLLAYFRPKAKFFWHLGVAYPENNREYRWLFKDGRIGLLVPSCSLKKEILEKFPRLERRIAVLPNGIVIPEVDADWARETLAVQERVRPEKLFVGIFSRLAAGKGHSLVFRALKQVRESGIDFHLWILGMGEKERLEREAAELGLTACVTFAGYRADVTPWMAGVDLVLFPSEKESFGYAAAEGMALGKPVLASEVGALPELIRNGTDGILLGRFEPSAWAEAIAELAQNPLKRKALGESGKARIEKEFSAARMVEGFLQIVDAHPAIGRA
jgi:glycosyltransferase involved in cell wall biosynthesis